RAGCPGSGASVGARHRERRGQLGLSLRELARRLEVSPSLVSQIETGKTQPSVRTLYAIVSELGVSLDEVFAPSGGDLDGHVQGRAARGRTARAPGAVPTSGEGLGRVRRSADRQVSDLGPGVRAERLTPWHDPEVA